MAQVSLACHSCRRASGMMSTKSLSGITVQWIYRYNIILFVASILQNTHIISVTQISLPSRKHLFSVDVFTQGPSHDYLTFEFEPLKSVVNSLLEDFFSWKSCMYWRCTVINIKGMIHHTTTSEALPCTHVFAYVKRIRRPDWIERNYFVLK